MTLATINNINKSIAKHGVEVVRGKGYFYFADIGDKYVADTIPSVYSFHLRCMTLEKWVCYVENAIQH